MAKSQQMEELSVKELISKYNFIVPEIQREYVWGKNENNILNLFFSDITLKFDSLEEQTKKSFNDLKQFINPTLNSEFNHETIEIIEKELKRFQSNRSVNIGFLYSYKPNYYIYNDVSEDVYLIDGQQRFTTLFLAIFYFAVIEKKIAEFINIFRINLNTEKIGFDYRVRNVTHNFLIDLIANTKTFVDIKDIANKTWFLSEYKNDTSIKAILGTFSHLNNQYSNRESGYFDFLLDHVKFWHFKTEETSQGEELYITMNSRGKALSGNEILRAKLFEKLPKEKVKKKGQDWEDWQDFFWSKKGENENSDNGFNEFLRWVQILSMVSKSKIDQDNEDEGSKDKKAIIEIIKWERTDLKLDIKYLNLDEITAYYKAVKYLFDDFSNFNFESIYTEYLNTELLDNNWLCPHSGSVIGQKECFRLLPVIQYVKLLLQREEIIENSNLFRVIRFFFNLNEIDTVNKSPSVACINAIKLIEDLAIKSNDIVDILNLSRVSKTLLTEEEKYKLSLYKNNKNRILIEQAFWKAEDHKLNSGRIGHLIQASFQTIDTIDNFKYEIAFEKVRELDFDLKKFKSVMNNFFVLNPERDKKYISGKLWGFLLPTTYYSISNYGHHKTITCQKNDYNALISKEFLKMVLEINPNETLSNYLTEKAKSIFRIYSESQNLKDETDLKVQLFCYFILLNDKGFWFWQKGKNFGCNDMSNEVGFICPFSNKNLFQHYEERWGGADWRIVDLHPILNGIDYLTKLENGEYWDKKVN